MKDLYAINAGYRKADIGVNWYYTFADSPEEALKHFFSTAVWLDVYGVVKCSEELQEDVLRDPRRYSVL